ncbi:hypothetical protein [Marinobacterium arenosum]|uniref:hypothetical protein n=1 Tax=Marinobacterium arenosum TaxID=2862496 RepID=UPI001C984652|nr:hypothetical protein [Marinobacterium arenosum]MBY4678527.1 hypothetical protein [Marinobacterium arenosum]
MNVTNALQSGLIGLNRTFDNVAKASGDLTGSGKPEQPEQASGVNNGPAVQETDVAAASGSDQVAATKVVTETEQTLGGNIDLHV